MRPDIVELDAFYASRQGQIARRLVAHQLRQLWPEVTGAVVAGIGYATPFLGALDAAERVIALMPSSQGVTRWPCDGASRVALVHEDPLPLPDRSVDRLLLAHAIESSPRPKRLLREAWRVLADDGRIVVMLPNRRGLWCWSDRTPFGHGQPYSVTQAARLLRSNLFEPSAERGALYLPPSGWPLMQRLALPIERVGLGTAPRFAGVLLVEAEKRLVMATPLPVKRRSRVSLRAQARPALAGVDRAPVAGSMTGRERYSRAG